MKSSKGKRILGVLASLRLAVFIIVALGVVSAVGTITEARFNDSEVANQLVYQSPWMYSVMLLLVVNLVAVMVSRWPWRAHHTGFILAHIGIIILLFGAWLTQRYGIDGNMAFEIGESRDVVTVKERDLMVYALGENGEMRAIHQGPANFLRSPPSMEKPLVVSAGADELRFVEHHQFAFRESEMLISDAKTDGPAIRFQLENPNVNMTQWLRREAGRPLAQLDLGPAKVVLSQQALPPSGRNEVILVPRQDSTILDYVIYNKDKGLRKKGQVVQSETVDTGWMGMKFRLLRFLQHSSERVSFKPISYFTPMTTSAVRFTLKGKDYWAGLDVPLKVFLEDRAYLVVYGHRQIPLNFSLRLKEFRMGKYQGTQRAASYESEVDVPDRGTVVISMNEPLKHQGFTFYQASFEQNERGEPTVSVLSVNWDPGRWLKYLGSLLIVAGSIILFYFKRAKIFRKGS